MTLTELQAFMDDHKGHDVNFESQEFIECMDCDETFELPEGTGVNILGSDDEDEVIVLEVPTGYGTHLKYVIEVETGLVTL